MSVPVNKRSQGKLEVCVQALDLCCYTLHIAKNKNVFTAEYQDSLTNKIIDTAIDIHSNVWGANNVLVKTADDYRIRRRMQDEAANKCNLLLSFIDIAKPIFHLTTKREIYWSKKVIRTRNLIRAWKSADYERYKKVIGM